MNLENSPDIVGGSSSEYSNQDVTASVKVSSLEQSLLVSLATEFKLSTVAEQDVCVGVAASTCKELIDGGVGAGFFLDFAAEVSWSTEEQTSSSTSYTFSYATSSDSNYPGRDSSMLLTPSLTIVFSKSLHVKFNKDVCMAIGNEVTTWSLTGTENFKVCLHFLFGAHLSSLWRGKVFVTSKQT